MKRLLLAVALLSCASVAQAQFGYGNALHGWPDGTYRRTPPPAAAYPWLQPMPYGYYGYYPRQRVSVIGPEGYSFGSMGPTGGYVIGPNGQYRQVFVRPSYGW